MAETRSPNAYVKAPSIDDSYLTPERRDEGPREVYLALEDDHELYSEPSDVCRQRGSLPRLPPTPQRSQALSSPPQDPPVKPASVQRVDPVAKPRALRIANSREIYFAVLVALVILVILLCGVILAGLKSLARRVEQHQREADRAVADLALGVQGMANRTEQSTAYAPGATPCTMTVGTDGGDPFTDLSEYTSYGPITALDIKVDSRNDYFFTGFRARYGSQKTDWRGFYSGQQETFVLRESEVITGMTVYVGTHTDGLFGLVGLSVLTNLHRQSIVYGAVNLEGGLLASLVHGRVDMSWDELLYFSGSAGAIVDNLMVHAVGCHSSEYIAIE